MSWQDYIPEDISEKYEVHDYKHAAAILASEFPVEFEELCKALREFELSDEDIKKPGGSESDIPKKFSTLLRPLGWEEKNLKAKLHVYELKGKNTEIPKGKALEHGSHKVDYLKGRVAFDLEWNSKDQTFDRDLYAFRAYYEYDAISVGVLVTRSNELDPYFKTLGQDDKGNHYYKKFGASTTHMGKLIPRLDAGRHGGCPVLVFGITTKAIQNH